MRKHLIANWSGSDNDDDLFGSGTDFAGSDTDVDFTDPFTPPAS